MQKVTELMDHDNVDVALSAVELIHELTDVRFPSVVCICAWERGSVRVCIFSTVISFFLCAPFSSFLFSFVHPNPSPSCGMSHKQDRAVHNYTALLSRVAEHLSKHGVRKSA